MFELVRRRVERELQRAGLKLPLVVHYESCPKETMRHLAACAGIPHRYPYPWVEARLEQIHETPWEITTYSPMGATAYVWDNSPISPERTTAHVTAHAALYHNHVGWAGLPAADTVGSHSRKRLSLIERRIGKVALWDFLDEVHECNKDNVRLEDAWQYIVLDQIERERAYLKPFSECQLLSEGFASYWEYQLTGKAQETGLYRLGRVLVEEVYHRDQHELLYQLTDLELLSGFYSPELAELCGYPWVAWATTKELHDLKALLLNY